MLNRLAILAVLFSIISALLPGQTPSQVTNDSGKQKRDGNSQQYRAAPSVPVVNPVSFPDTQKQSGGQKGGEEKIAVSTAEPLKIQANISDPFRDPFRGRTGKPPMRGGQILAPTGIDYLESLEATRPMGW
jgi:hypothetical protein